MEGRWEGEREERMRKVIRKQSQGVRPFSWMMNCSPKTGWMGSKGPLSAHSAVEPHSSSQRGCKTAGHFHCALEGCEAHWHISAWTEQESGPGTAGIPPSASRNRGPRSSTSRYCAQIHARGAWSSIRTQLVAQR